jgi:putative ubiquitin-RnfH superfamily antitoxin RatB of RatAB toxin-antitoxin module
MKVGIAYAIPKHQVWLTVDVPEGATLRDAVERSGILQQFPEIDLEHQKVGVFGKLVALDSKLEDGDRVEIYRPLVADPKTIKSRTKGESAPDRAADS